MITKTIYKNDKGEIVSEQQIALLSIYQELIYVDEILKEERKYRNSKPWGAYYYLNLGEEAITILGQLDSNFKWSFLTTEVINGYKVFTSKSFDENLELKQKYSKRVFNIENNFVATVMFDTQTNLPISAFKVFQFWENEEITFNFNNEGGIQQINISSAVLNNEMTYTNLDSFLRDINEFIGDFISQEQLEYYTQIEPVVPDF